MGDLDEGRRAVAAGYLRGRTLEEALAAWRSDYDSPANRERRPRLARLGNVIRRLATEAEAQDEATTDHPQAAETKKPAAARPGGLMPINQSAGSSTRLRP